LDGFKSLRMPSMTPMATLYVAIPICGVLVALFTIEQMINGWRHGFSDDTAHHESRGSEAL
jgi:TRAP-type C4-dicarboxylate transport system permease small subunit